MLETQKRLVGKVSSRLSLRKQPSHTEQLKHFISEEYIYKKNINLTAQQLLELKHLLAVNIMQYLVE